MSLDKTLLTPTALRDGLKSLWKPAAFWIEKDRVDRALMKRLLSVVAVLVAFHRIQGNQFVLQFVTCKHRPEVVQVKLCDLYFEE